MTYLLEKKNWYRSDKCIIKICMWEYMRAEGVALPKVPFIPCNTWNCRFRGVIETSKLIHSAWHFTQFSSDCFCLLCLMWKGADEMRDTGWEEMSLWGRPTRGKVLLRCRLTWLGTVAGLLQSTASLLVVWVHRFKMRAGSIYIYIYIFSCGHLPACRSGVRENGYSQGICLLGLPSQSIPEWLA